MRVTASAVCCALLMSAAVASAQPTPSHEYPSIVEIGPVETPPELVDPRSDVHVGVALFISGLSTFGAGLGLQLGFGGMIGLAGGGTLMGLGSVLLVSGIPTWIVGAVREDIASAGPDGRARTASDWELAGGLVFGVSMATAVAGAAMVGAAATQQYDEGQLIAGATMLTISVFIAAFVGAPMWAEGARF